MLFLEWVRNALSWYISVCYSTFSAFPQLTVSAHSSLCSNSSLNRPSLFQILKDDAVKALNSICQQIWRTQQWPQDWRRSVFIPIPKKGNAKECSNYCTNYCVTSRYLGYFHSNNQWVGQSTSPRWLFSESLLLHGLAHLFSYFLSRPCFFINTKSSRTIDCGTEEG